MVLLGGLNALAGPLVGAAAFTWLQDSLARATEYWRAVLGGAILVLVLAFPLGIGGALRSLLAQAAGRDDAARRRVLEVVRLAQEFRRRRRRARRFVSPSPPANWWR